MIPYSDLAAALDRWRARKGLVTSQASTYASAPAVIAPAVIAPAPVAAPKAPPMAPPAASPAAVAARAVPSAPPPRAVTEDPVDLADADMIDDESYENAGNDFAMSFAQPGAPRTPAPLAELEDEGLADESTMIGANPATTDSGIPAPGLDTLDADGDVLDEAFNPDAGDELP